MSNYGCISDNLLTYKNVKIPSNLKIKIDNIINKSYKIIYNEEDVDKLSKEIKNYSLNYRNKFANKYDDIHKNFLNVYKKNKKVNLILKNKMNKITDIVNYFVINLKIKFNIPRPFQLSYKYNKCIYPVPLVTTHSPSCPSGHTALYYILFKYFSKIDKVNENKYFNIYLNGMNSRVIGGVHFHKDNYYSIYFMKLIENDILNLY